MFYSVSGQSPVVCSRMSAEASLNISVNGLDEGIKKSLCKFANNTNLGWNIDCLKVFSLQRDLR